MLHALKRVVRTLPPFRGILAEPDALAAKLGAMGAYAHASYVADGMCLLGKSLNWAEDPAFSRAYAAGLATGHRFGQDVRIDWRVHVVCWAASHARRLPGDFVECGVNTGILSVAICTYLDFNSLDKTFWLYDTFEGIPKEQMTAGERGPRSAENDSWYFDCYSTAARNFAPWPRARLVKGRIPETLASSPEQVSYLSIDMNIVEPEIAAIEHFWPLLSSGAPVVLDDYGFEHHAIQREGMDRFARAKGVKILTLPTGQGLILKP
jgi:hypothetical protein